MLNRIGDPLNETTLIGPLHTEQSVTNYKNTIDEIKKQGGTIEFGGKVKIIKIFTTLTLPQSSAVVIAVLKFKTTEGKSFNIFITTKHLRIKKRVNGSITLA